MSSCATSRAEPLHGLSRLRGAASRIVPIPVTSVLSWARWRASAKALAVISAAGVTELTKLYPYKAILPECGVLSTFVIPAHAICYHFKALVVAERARILLQFR